MAPTQYDWKPELERIQVSSGNLQIVRTLFDNGGLGGRGTLTAILYERMSSLIGWQEAENCHNIAVLLDELTACRTEEQAKDFVKGEAGTEWLCTFLVEKAMTVAPRRANTTTALETPLITLAGSDSNIPVERDVLVELRRAMEPTEVSDMLPNGLTGPAGLYGSIGPQDGTSTLSSFQESRLRHSVYSGPPSDVSLEPETRCLYPNNPSQQQLSAPIDHPSRTPRSRSYMILAAVLLVYHVMIIILFAYALRKMLSMCRRDLVKSA